MPRRTGHTGSLGRAPCLVPAPVCWQAHCGVRAQCQRDSHGGACSGRVGWPPVGCGSAAPGRAEVPHFGAGRGSSREENSPGRRFSTASARRAGAWGARWSLCSTNVRCYILTALPIIYLSIPERFSGRASPPGPQETERWACASTASCSEGAHSGSASRGPTGRPHAHHSSVGMPGAPCSACPGPEAAGVVVRQACS